MKQILWALVAGGVWIAVSPWILGFSSVNLARWSNVLAGGLVAIGAFALTSRSEP
ncbi:MAG: SPW repeat protein [Candidatus Jorgensenbacteria bacterium]|nr:SPW repeat protein [Candidatus Jorgensenbacteria bacterium]